jgi:hypothetical protein
MKNNRCTTLKLASCNHVFRSPSRLQDGLQRLWRLRPPQQTEARDDSRGPEAREGCGGRTSQSRMVGHGDAGGEDRDPWGLCPAAAIPRFSWAEAIPCSSRAVAPWRGPCRWGTDAAA